MHNPGGSVFQKLPDWVAQEVPKARDAWAPDISLFNGKYHLYYRLEARFSVRENTPKPEGLTRQLPVNASYRWVRDIKWKARSSLWSGQAKACPTHGAHPLQIGTLR